MGAAAAALALHLIHTHGGFYTPAPITQFAQDGPALVRNLGIVFEGLLLLGGGDFLGLRLGASTAFIMLHVVGVVLAGWGAWLAARRFLRDNDLIDQLLVTGVAINLAAYVFSTQAVTITGTREIGAVLPLSAALAGRLLAWRCKRPGWRRSCSRCWPATWSAWPTRSASHPCPPRTSSSPHGWPPGTCRPACPATGSRTWSR